LIDFQWLIKLNKLSLLLLVSAASLDPGTDRYFFYQQLNSLGPFKIKFGMNGRESSLRLLKTSLMNRKLILSASWFEESLLVNTKELVTLIRSILMSLLMSISML